MAKQKKKTKINKKLWQGKIKRKISSQRKPVDMTVEEWQYALRQQSAKTERFRIKNSGEETVFSEFTVTNLTNKTDYRVVIRGDKPGVNFCSCPDYAVNTLGTCKHIERVLLKLKRTRAGREAMKSSFRQHFSEVYLRYGAKREVMFSPGESTTVRTINHAKKYFDSKGTLTENGIKEFDKFHRYLKKAEPDMRCYDDALDFIAQKRDAFSRNEVITRHFGNGKSKNNGKTVQLKGIKVPLYSYQYKGAVFAAKKGRSIIADEMGLGKTIQAIAAVEILSGYLNVERVLIVCPTSLKHQWKMEIEKFCNRDSVIVEGPVPKRRHYYTTKAFYTIANYEQIFRDLRVVQNLEWDVIILDETQRIKNWKTLTSRAVKTLNSQYAIALTGTPLENRLEELHSIVSFIDKYKLGPLFRFLENHQVTEGDTGKVIGYRNLSKINKSLEDILIRRNKKQVLTQLPERIDKNYFVTMTQQQWDIHTENAATVAQVVNRWKRFRRLTESDQRRLMIALQNMRMSCDSTYLLDQKIHHGPKLDELLTVLNDILQIDGEKMVIFSQWTKMHELICGLLEKNKIAYVFLHGGIPSKKRGGLVKSFRTDPAVKVFLSTDAGGLGLNLQKASVVVNMDLPWNPAVLEQRIGRVHRLGQHKPVRVINFISEGTIEHGMLSLLAFKRSLFTNVLDGGEDMVFMGESRFNKFIKDVEKITTNIPTVPHEPPGQTFQAESEGFTETEREKIAHEEPSTHGETPGTTAPVSSQVDMLQHLFTQGAAFLQDMASSLQNGNGGNGHENGFEPRIEKDEATGRDCLKIPLPDKDTIMNIVTLIQSSLTQVK
jgi:SNF2 family DNA or RNA helicase